MLLDGSLLLLQTTLLGFHTRLTTDERVGLNLLHEVLVLLLERSHLLVHLVLSLCLLLHEVLGEVDLELIVVVKRIGLDKGNRQ